MKKNLYCGVDRERPAASAPEGPSLFERIQAVVWPYLKVLLPLLVNLYCLIIYYQECAEKDWNKLVYVAYMTSIANAFFGLPCFSDESYTDLRILLCYAHEILPLPCICAEIWKKHEAATDPLNYLPAFFGFAAFGFFIVFEYKRLDLTDLAIFSSAIGMALVSAVNENVFGFLAAAVYAGYYLWRKRREECCMQNQDTFSYVMMVFNLVSLAAFEPNSWVPELPNMPSSE